MMSRWLFGVLTAGVVAALTPVVLADDSGRPAHPGPEALFKRLDANQDGRITADEIPEKAPDRLKAMLKRADENGDEKLTAEEFGQAMSRFHQGLREAQSQRHGPPHPPSAGPHHSPAAGPHRQPMPPRFERSGGERSQPYAASGRPGIPDPKTIFARLDRDNDGQLNFAEFAGGMRQFHERGRPPFAGPPRLPGGMLAGEAFQRADADHDGKVTLEEVPSDRRERFAALLGQADKDGDKALSAEEARRFAAAAMMRTRMAMAHRAIEARTGDTARRVVASRQAAEAQRPAVDKTTPEARKKAAEAKGAAAEAKRAAAKKAAKAKKRKRKEAQAKREAASSNETE